VFKQKKPLKNIYSLINASILVVAFKI